jgi:hypothetical protein
MPESIVRSLNKVRKVPSAILVGKEISWELEEFAAGESITAFVVDSITPTTAPALQVVGIGNLGAVSQIRIEGGVAENDYLVAFHVDTNQGQKLYGELLVEVRA